jgi:DNA-directed RNA polymerase specialized sigma24 family protein
MGLAGFTDLDWEDLYPRLLLATKGRMSRVRWRGQQWATAPMGLLAEDFVQIAIKEAMSGERRYDSSKSLFKNLYQIVSSEISNVVQSYENKNVEHEDDDNIINFVDYRDSPETAAIYTQMVDRFLIYLEARDLPAKQVAEQIILCDLVKSLELSVELRRPVSDIENTKKRLRRLCREYQQKHEGKPVLPSAVKKTSDGGS